MVRHASVFRMLAIVAVVFVCASATALAAADPNGTWQWKFTTQNGQEFELSVTLKADGDKLTGQLTLPMGDNIDIKEGSLVWPGGCCHRHRWCADL